MMTAALFLCLLWMFHCKVEIFYQEKSWIKTLEMICNTFWFGQSRELAKKSKNTTT
jgi:hypothetical protein